MKITAAQLARLQTCCCQMGRSVVGFENTREARLAWASGVLGRAVATFTKLSLDEARTLIDAAQGELGHRAPLKPASIRTQRLTRTPEEAQRAGVDGRHDGEAFADRPEMVSPELLATIASYYRRLGWDEVRFGAWLASKSSPIKAKAVRTTAQANRVLWALKGMLKDAGLWIDWSKAS